MKEQYKSRQRVTDHGEVFTNEREVNAMLDLMKNEVQKTDSRILEPACGDGNFLAEILKRKIKNIKCRAVLLADDLKKQYITALSSLYGIDILYDNVIACRERLLRIWKQEYSAVSEINEDTVLSVENILKSNIICANTLTGNLVDENGNETDEPYIFYDWYFTEKHDELSEQRAFDIVVSNPPYHQNDGGNGASATPIYNLFVERAKALEPQYISMIIPARWYAGGKGLDLFRDRMLNDRRLTELHDFVSAADCFSGVEIKGGVCYFLWERDREDDCLVVSHVKNNVVSTMKRPLLEDGNHTFIRYNDAVKILRKIRALDEPSFAEIVSTRKPFGLPTNFKDYNKTADVSCNANIYARGEIGYVSREQAVKNDAWIDMWKVYVPEAIGAGNMAIDVVKPIIGPPNTLCSETYLLIGPAKNETEAENIKSYIETKFFHFLLGLKKITQHTTVKTYEFIPFQDFSKSWTDDALYKKYHLSKDEMEFIERSVWNAKK